MNYKNQILVELVKLANLIITVTKAVACGNRIQSIFEIPCSMKNGTREIKNTITSLQFDHVGLTLGGGG